MTTATMRRIESVERLNMSGEIGDGTVANLHDLAGLARLECRKRDDALQDIAEAEAIPDYAGAFVWCRSVARLARRT